MKKLFATGGIISTLLIAGVLVVLAIPRHQLLAFAIVLAIEFYVWWRRHDSDFHLAMDTYDSWLSSLIAVVLVALSPQSATQVLTIAVFIGWRLAAHAQALKKYPGIKTLAMQFASLCALFSAAQVWR